MGLSVCEGRGLGATIVRRIKVVHLAVSLEAFFQHLLVSVVVYMPTIVKKKINSKQILNKTYLKTV